VAGVEPSGVAKEVSLSQGASRRTLQDLALATGPFCEGQHSPAASAEPLTIPG